MNKYRIYCTEEQTKKALELGAPIEVDFQFNDKTAIINKKAYIVPIAEEMLGWLEEQDVINYITISNTGDDWYYDINTIDDTLFLGNLYCGSRKEATLAAIDVALEYLISKKGE